MRSVEEIVKKLDEIQYSMLGRPRAYPELARVYIKTEKKQIAIWLSEKRNRTVRICREEKPFPEEPEVKYSAEIDQLLNDIDYDGIQYELERKGFEKVTNPLEKVFLKRAVLRRNDRIETARINYSPILRRIVIEYNIKWVVRFGLRLIQHSYSEDTLSNGMALVLRHEINHYLMRHFKINMEDKEFINVVGDLAINRKIIKGWYWLPGAINGHIVFKGHVDKEKVEDEVRKLLLVAVGDRKVGKVYTTKAVISGEVEVWYEINEEYYNEFLKENSFVLIQALANFYEIFDKTDVMSRTYLVDGGDNGVEVSLEERDYVKEVIAEVTREKDSAGIGDAVVMEARKLGLKITNVSNRRVLFWRRKLGSILSQSMSTEERYFSDRPSFRVEGQLGREEDVRTLKKVRLLIDCSGSMGPMKFNEVLKEIAAISKSIPNLEFIVVFWGTSYVSFTCRARDLLTELQKRAVDLGGTRLERAFEGAIETGQADIDFVFTDGHFNINESTVLLRKKVKNPYYVLTSDGSDTAILELEHRMPKRLIQLE